MKFAVVALTVLIAALASTNASAQEVCSWEVCQYGCSVTCLHPETEEEIYCRDSGFVLCPCNDWQYGVDWEEVGDPFQVYVGSSGGIDYCNYYEDWLRIDYSWNCDRYRGRCAPQFWFQGYCSGLYPYGSICIPYN